MSSIGFHFVLEAMAAGSVHDVDLWGAGLSNDRGMS